MKYNIISEGIPSRRGNYNIVKLDENPIIWIPELLDLSNKRHLDVIAEVRHAKFGKLAAHPYWKDEPIEFINHYQDFYTELFSLKWLHKRTDRHNIVVNPNCCLTLVQYENGRLTAYSRSTDMRNGYHSDRLILNLLADVINQERPDCKVHEIVWYIAIPHIYEEKGIARLIDKEDYTNGQK